LAAILASTTLGSAQHCMHAHYTMSSWMLSEYMEVCRWKCNDQVTQFSEQPARRESVSEIWRYLTKRRKVRCD